MKHYEELGNVTSHPVIFDNLSSLSHDQKVPEAIKIFFARADTTSSTLTAGLFHILSDQRVYDKPVHALQVVQADSSGRYPLLELKKKIEYLVWCLFHPAFPFRNTWKVSGLTPLKEACVKESIRTAIAVLR